MNIRRNKERRRKAWRRKERNVSHAGREARTGVPTAEISKPDHMHEWVLFSTALAEGWLMVQCVQCGLHGTVNDPTKEEWSAAFYAPSKPYRWKDDSRVITCSVGPLYVARSDSDPGVYERIPREIMGKVLPVTPEERQQLEEMAEVVRDGDLDGRLFPLFIRSYQRDTGDEFTGAVRRLADRLEDWTERAFPATAETVAGVLKWYAREGELLYGGNGQ